MNFSYSYLLRPAQRAEAVDRNRQRLLRQLPARRPAAAASVVLWTALGFTLTCLLRLVGDERSGSLVPALLAAALVVGAWFVREALIRRDLARLGDDRGSDSPWRLEVEDAGLRFINARGESMTPWSDIVGCEATTDIVLLYRKGIAFDVIPTTAFASAAELAAFIAHVGDRIDAAAIPRPNAQAAAAPGVLTSLRTTLASAVKLAFFVAVAPERIIVRWWLLPVFALPGVLDALLAGGQDFALGEGIPWSALPDALFPLPMLLLAGIAAACALGRPERTLLLVQAFLMIALVVDAVFTAGATVFLELAPALAGRAFDGGLDYLPPVWLTLASASAAVRLAPAGLFRSAAAVVLCAVLVALPLSLVYRDRELWLPPEASVAGGDPLRQGALGEDVVYAQPKLLAQALGDLEPGVRGQTDVFFIGVAGDGQQDVFRREVEAVSELFEQRFDAAGRTIRLINNESSPTLAPMASVTSLRAALARVAELMNDDEDVLFLFLTSHGSEAHELMLDLGSIRFDELDPLRLRALLDESGIRQRAVVISACFSGGFLDALKDEHTLVITAAAADKTSFGCSNDADWTYFGKAYFDEALRRTYSFSEAFSLAKPLIARREAQDDYPPSEPQIAEGAAIGAKLSVLRQRLESEKRR